VLQDEEAPTNIIDEVLQRRKRAKKRDTDQEVTDEVMSLVSMVSTPAAGTAAAAACRRPALLWRATFISCSCLLWAQQLCNLRLLLFLSLSLAQCELSVLLSTCLSSGWI
jgi:hypothetical protein